MNQPSEVEITTLTTLEEHIAAYNDFAERNRFKYRLQQHETIIGAVEFVDIETGEVNRE